jgi:acyl transferase domain-containing protein/SAM-dependent methyltransferase
MGKDVNRAEDLSPVKRALVQLRQMRARVDEAERARREPIAIVGIGCRFPGGASSPEAFWDLLANGVDAIGEVPADRWDLGAYFDADPDAAGKIYTRYGGFLDDIDRFDASFFNISPREAAAMDPQQRMLLEVCWQALEDSGQPVDRLMGANVGVFVGLSASDYLQLELRATPVDQIDPYLATGGTGSVAAGRVSYVLGFQGPCMTVDTACSSSLVAVHLAMQSLRAGECRLALAGGASAILLPELTVNFCRARMLAPDGRCKTFDRTADGYVRSEGCGIVVLRRLSDAVASGDRILAVIRGSAINQDGRSGGLTVPNGTAQTNVIREALAAGGVPAPEVAYVEAHGTGTSLGDPIELRALGEALTRERAASSPLLVGSVKTNIGHTEAAAGIAGLIKVVLALQHGEIPPHLHVRERNPLVDWAELKIEVPGRRTAWPGGQPRTAGVSSFGFSGTNAHIILQEAPPTPARAETHERAGHALTVSARSEEALREAAGALRDHLRAHPETSFADVCHTRNAGRSHFAHRLALVSQSTEAAAAALGRWMAGETPAGLVTGRSIGHARPRVAFLFDGHGAQVAGMGHGLYETEPRFRAAIDRAAATLEPLLDRPLLSLLYGADGALLDHTRYAQPALFAFEWALADLWRSWGIEPDVVLGHSLGEDVAACVAGVFSFEDGLKMVAARGRLMDEAAAPGEMHAVFAPLELVAAEVGREQPAVSIAAINGPESVVISGESAAIARTLQRLQGRGVKTRSVSGRYACHSPLMDPLLPAMRQVTERVAYAEPALTFVSNISGRVPSAPEVTSADYWCRHMREPVRFFDAFTTVAGQGPAFFVEIGPDSLLLRLAQRCTPATDGVWVQSLRTGGNDSEQMLTGLATLYANGAAVDWQGVDRPFTRSVVALPTYPFERRRFWFEQPPPQPDAAPAPAPASVPAPLQDADAIWASVAAAVRVASEHAPLDLHLASYQAKWAALDRLTTAYIVSALRSLGVFCDAGDELTVEEMIAGHGIQPVYGTLVRRWCERLAAAGLLTCRGTSFVAPQPLPDLGPDVLLHDVRSLFGDYPAVLAYAERCGPALADVLAGHESPLELLFPSGSLEMAEGLYEQAPLARYMNGIVRAAVQAAAARPDGVRLLELGGGTGGTTSALLPVLRRDRTTYTFTDVGPLFVNRAQEKFAAFDFVRYGVLDLERPITEQGYEPHAYHVVVASNVLHATRNLDETLRHVSDLLEPGGLLVLVEATRYFEWMDATIGLAGSWQRFEDTWRGEHPLLPPERWASALARNGFGRFEAVPGPDHPAQVLGQHVIVARAPLVAGAVTAGQAAQGVAAEGSGPAPAPAAGPPAPAAPADADTGLLAELRQLPPGERRERVVAIVRGAVMRVLRLDESRQPDRGHRLMDMGVDSLLAVELRNILRRALQTKRLPATLIFDHPTIDAVAAYLDRTFVSPATEAPATPAREREAAPALAAAVDVTQLDDAAVEALLNERLQQMRSQ